MPQIEVNQSEFEGAQRHLSASCASLSGCLAALSDVSVTCIAQHELQKRGYWRAISPASAPFPPSEQGSSRNRRPALSRLRASLDQKKFFQDPNSAEGRRRAKNNSKHRRRSKNKSNSTNIRSSYRPAALSFLLLLGSALWYYLSVSTY